MTRKRRTPKQAEAVKLQLAQIIRDLFDTNGQIVTHDELAAEHVSRNRSITAAEDVATYGGPAVVHLRNEMSYAIVPVTSKVYDFSPDTEVELVIANAVAGLGAGGPRIGWYHPTDRDDWLWVYYVGHLGRAGVAAVFHASRQADANPSLISAKGRGRIAGLSGDSLIAPGKTETRILTERLGEGEG
jgi:hypothetical protein